MKIEKIKYKDIKNMHANNNIIATHYIVDYEYDRYDYYIDINIQDYLYDEKDIDKEHDVYEEYIENGFFVYYDEGDIDNFINIYGYLFNEDLIDDICKIVDEMNKVQKKEKEV